MNYGETTNFIINSRSVSPKQIRDADVYVSGNGNVKEKTPVRCLLLAMVHARMLRYNIRHQRSRQPVEKLLNHAAPSGRHRRRKHSLCSPNR